MNRSKHIRWATALVAGSLMIAGGIFARPFLGTGGLTSASADRPPDAAAPREVDVTVAERRSVERVVEAVGTLRAFEEATLRVKVAGRVDEVRVDLGDRTSRGEVVAIVERDDYELEVRRAEAQLEQALARLGLENNDGTAAEIDRTSVVRQARATLDEARRRLERLQQLSEPGIVSKADLDAAAVAVEVAEAGLEDAAQEARHRLAMLAERRVALAIAERELEETILRAPFDGAVTQRVAHPGEYLGVGDAVVSLVRTDRVRVRLEVPERLASRIAPGQPLRFRLEADGDLHEAFVERISPIIEPGNRMLVVEATVAHGGELRPGSFMRGQIVVDPADPAVTVPPTAVASFAGIHRVFVVEEGLAAEREVTLGQHGGRWVEVEGVEPGEIVILQPGNLRGGTEVRFAAPASSTVAVRRDAR